jgi:GR25 family glycosyltransferase involved in LPS biosynthesis
MEGSIHIYCINLKHRGDRWERFSKQPELAALTSQYSFDRFEGVNGSALDMTKDERISLRTKRNIREHIRRDHEELDSAGGVGCYLSHTTVWKKFLERPEAFCIVFEDDAEIEPGFTVSLQHAMRDVTLLPQVPDLWFFSLPFTYLNPKTKSVGPWTLNACGPFTGYMLSRRGAERLLETAFPIDMHVDMYSCLAGDLGRVLAVMHNGVSLTAFSMKENDTDIQVTDKACLICDVPTNFRSKGIIIVNIPLLIIGVAALMGMYYLGIGKRGGRR